MKATGVANRNAMNAAIMNTGPTLVAVAAFVIYSGIMHRPMEPSVVFPSLSLFSLLGFPVMFYPRCLSLCADAVVALRRLQGYFLLAEAGRPRPVEAPDRGGRRAKKKSRRRRSRPGPREDSAVGPGLRRRAAGLRRRPGSPRTPRPDRQALATSSSWRCPWTDDTAPVGGASAVPGALAWASSATPAELRAVSGPGALRARSSASISSGTSTGPSRADRSAVPSRRRPDAPPRRADGGGRSRRERQVGTHLRASRGDAPVRRPRGPPRGRRRRTSGAPSRTSRRWRGCSRYR